MNLSAQALLFQGFCVCTSSSTPNRPPRRLTRHSTLSAQIKWGQSLYRASSRAMSIESSARHFGSRRSATPPIRRAIARRVDCRGLCRRAPTSPHSRPYRDCSAAHCRQVDVLDPVGSAAPDPLESPRNRIPRLLDPPKPYFSAPPATNSAHSLRHPPTRGRLTRPPRANSPHSNREKCRKWPCESIEVDVAQ